MAVGAVDWVSVVALGSDSVVVVEAGVVAVLRVDVVFPGWVPFAYLAESQNIPGWLDAPAHALGYPFHTFIGGHLTRLGTRDDVTIQQQYVADLKAAAADAIEQFGDQRGLASHVSQGDGVAVADPERGRVKRMHHHGRPAFARLR